MFSPAAYLPSVHAASAVFQTQESTWSPFGPRTEKLLITGYSDFNAMFSAFNSGQLDMTDWPLDPSHLAQFNTNPDVYITSKEAEFGIFQLDINHHHPLFGVSQHTPRVMVAATFTTSTGTAACSVGFGTVTVQLINRENGTSLVKNKFNKVSIQEFPLGAPSFSTTDSSGSGTYTFACVNAESPLSSAGYTITSTEYNTTTNTVTTIGAASTHLAAIALGSQQTVNVVLTVNYLSPSTQSETQLGIYARAAVLHMLDKPDFVQSDSSLAGLAVCDDIMLPPGDRLTGSGCLQPGADPNQHGFNPAVLEQLECGPLSSVDPTFTAACTVSNYLSANHIGPASSLGAGLWWNLQHTGTAGYSNPNDIRAACDYLLLAGFTLTPSGSTCAQVAAESSLASPPATYVHFVPTAGAASMAIMYIRTSVARNHFGQTIADTINFLFGTANGACINNGGTAFSAVDYGTKEPKPCTVGTNVTPQYYTIGQVVPIVFADAGKDIWNLYTGGFSLGSTPDFLWANFHSTFASTVCGGVFNSFPANDNYHCDPAYDAYSNAAEFAPNLAAANNIFNQTAVFALKNAMNDPVYSVIDQFAELNCLNWQPGSQSSIVKTLGHGTETAFWTLLNMQANPSYTPVNPASYSCSGGQPETIRRGFSQDTDNMNPYQALTVWDFEIIGLVFDTLLAVNPVTGGATQQLFDWMTQSHQDSAIDNTEYTCIGAPTYSSPVCATGTLTQTWVLRHDLRFHDGTQVNANDICYSIIAPRDAVAALLYSAVVNVASCIPIVGGGTAANPDTVQVKIQGGGAFSDIYIGGLPIIPSHGPHSWATICGGALVQSTITGPDGKAHPYTSIANAPTSSCADPNYDPMAAGMMVGNGPWACNSLTNGASGGPCTSTHNAVVSLGDTALLTANSQYMRGPPDLQGSSIQTYLYADRKNVGHVDILDIADASGHFCVIAPCAAGTPGADPYWSNPAYTCGGEAFVDICAVGTAAGYFGHAMTGNTPETGAGSMTNLDMSSLAFSIGGVNAAGVQSGEQTCSVICISAQQIVNEAGTVHLKVAYVGSTLAASLTNVKVQVSSDSNPFTSVGPFALTANSVNDFNLGVAFPANNEVTITFNVVFNGVTVGAATGVTGTLYVIEREA